MFRADVWAPPEAIAAAAANASLALPPVPVGAETVALKVNETWIGHNPADIADRSDRLLRGAAQ
ncbi:MAG: hypothetical protein ACTS3R_00515 [Inquilinaceae bacterium]